MSAEHSAGDAGIRTAIQHLLAVRGEELEFVVLFGSRARGDWSPESDYDVLIGLRADDGLRLIDRIGVLSALVDGNVDLFPYARSEWQRMFDDRHILFLDALEHGMPLHDRGGFGTLRETFLGWRRAGDVVPYRNGWRIADLEREARPEPPGSIASGLQPRVPRVLL